MGRPKLSDTATSEDCDWAFTEDEELMEALRRRAARAIRPTWMDPEDVLQELILWLGVRPEKSRMDIGLVMHSLRKPLADLADLARGRPTDLELDEGIDRATEVEPSRGSGISTGVGYDFATVEQILTVLFNGGKPWRSETAPDADLPPASKGDPAQGNSFLAAKIDVERAWFAVFHELQNPLALWMFYGEGATKGAIAKELGVRSNDIEGSRIYDVMRIRDAANLGLRPTGPDAAFYRMIRGIK